MVISSVLAKDIFCRLDADVNESSRGPKFGFDQATALLSVIAIEGSSLVMELYEVKHNRHYVITLCEREVPMACLAWALGQSDKSFCADTRRSISLDHTCDICEEVKMVQIEHNPAARDFVRTTVATIVGGVLPRLP